MGMDGISKDRWNLASQHIHRDQFAHADHFIPQKCSSCTDLNAQKYGSKIQCTKGKCVRAYHVTCAIRDPHVEFQELEVDEWVALEDARSVGTVQEGDMQVDGGVDVKQKAKRFERVTVVHAQCLCPQHNPVGRPRKLFYVGALNRQLHNRRSRRSRRSLRNPPLLRNIPHCRTDVRSRLNWRLEFGDHICLAWIATKRVQLLQRIKGMRQRVI